MAYEFAQIEQRWQQYWQRNKTFATPNPGDSALSPDAPKFYVLDMFPYPSGVGLHVGHPLGYIATDIVARHKRMLGYNVLHPMGYDAFGLPAEQFAVEHGVHPAITTQQNIDNMTRQLKALGLGYDWDRTVATTDPKYYRWTQWIFLQLYYSYFDEVENKARPISELIRKLESERYYIGLDGELIPSGVDEDMESLAGTPIGVRKWHELDHDQRANLLDEYRLAYLADVAVNWCPALGTVLANEEVTNDGRSERGNHPVFKRPLKQWMLRITAYAQRLIDDLDLVDWPESTKLLQRNWVGKSTGAYVDFTIAHADAEQGSASEASGMSQDIIRVFTTRPDTLFGATYMVLAPEHPLVESITTGEQYHDVNQYIQQAVGKSDIDRQAETKDKTGVFTGAYAINPVNGEKLPIWIADYVMMGYGTGAIMAVPAHDERDFAFATKFELPIIQVVQPSQAADEERSDESGGSESGGSPEHAFTGKGVNINSANDDVSLDGLPTDEAKIRITDWLASKGLGEAATQFKLRDWLFSRQRYWGEPFPILHELDDQGQRTGRIRAVDASDLPVKLPEMDDFSPTASDAHDAPPKPPLGRAPESWRRLVIDGVTYERELNTMPQWAGSCWYYLRYLDPRNTNCFVDPDVEQYWMSPTSRDREGAGSSSGGGVDLYVGGVEHAVLHLLYARFWHKVLFDLGHVSSPEPFGKLFNQGYIQAFCYRDERGIAVPAEEVVDQDGKPAMQVQDEPGRQFFHQGQPVTQEYGKMGKSLKNAVNPDDMISEFGCDTLRLYEMYMGPLDQSKPWNTRDIVGVHRFLNRVWRNFVSDDDQLLIAEAAPDKDLARQTHKTIARVRAAMDAMQFNVAIAALIELNNALVSLDRVPRWVGETFVAMLAPLAPHISEELWKRLGHQPSVADLPYPAADEKMLIEDQVELPVQVNGKLRGKITVPADAPQDVVEAAAKSDENVAAHLEGKAIRKVIVVPGKLINLVVG